MSHSSAPVALLEKAAVDNGFDVGGAPVADWLSFASTHAPLEVWLTAGADGRPVVALSRMDVAQALAELGVPANLALPPGAAVAHVVADLQALHALLRRAWQLARALPDEPLRAFEKAMAKPMKTTEVEQLVRRRVGQDIFRAKLLEYWDGRCAITGLAIPELLRASHIKPWADCATDAERLDPFNGLLLAAHLDAAFDAGLMTVGDDGAVEVSTRLGADARSLLGLAVPLRVTQLDPGHRGYLPWHRTKVFR